MVARSALDGEKAVGSGRLWPPASRLGVYGEGRADSPVAGSIAEDVFGNGVVLVEVVLVEVDWGSDLGVTAAE